MSIYPDNQRIFKDTVMGTKVTTVNNIVEAREEINKLVNEGYSKESLYVITHSEDRTKHIANNMNLNTIGIAEEGVITAIANLFRSHGDELRAKLRSMGVSREHAEKLESDLDRGKIVILAWNNQIYVEDQFNPYIDYYRHPYL